MQVIFAIVTILGLNAQAGARAETIRIGLFSLFKPQVVHARIWSGESARLDLDGSSSGVSIARGDVVRCSLSGGRLQIKVSDSFGRIKLSRAASEARISPAGATMIELSLPGKMRRTVRGDVSIARSERRSSNQLKIILSTDGEMAVASIVAAELGGQRAPEAFKALAVAVRTYMLSHQNRHADEGFDFCDTTHCQLYRGEQDLSLEARSPVVASAVAQTRGEYLSYHDKTIEGYYTAVCGGLSVTPEMVWGGANASNYPYQRIACRWCRKSRYARWTRSADAALALDALSSTVGFQLSQLSQLRVESDEPSGFARAVTIRDNGREVRLSADEFRRAIGRRLGWNKVLSPSFTIERQGRLMIFHGRGFGSQIGLCLAGAVEQAKAGRGYQNILNFYYPHTEIKGRAMHE
ncbi:MAG TPA: SpoIID/LytB domain-containing protein [Blastocatellia bacterium]|nr:SpoIID/LytB domain-containing protein [Blastocatellia bacterium]